MRVDVSEVVWAAGLSIEEIARRCETDGAYVNRLIHGKLPLTEAMARKLENASGIPRLEAMMRGFDPLPVHGTPPSSDRAA